MAVTEARRTSNRLRQAAWRQRQQIKRTEEKLRIQAQRAVQEAILEMVPPQELLRAGQVAGMLEIAFRHRLPLTGEEWARSWLDSHPVGESYVSELLSIAGLGSFFLRWRG